MKQHDVWIAIVVLTVVCFAIKAAGPMALGGRDLPRWADRLIALVWGELGDRGARVTAATATLIAVVLIPIAPPGIPVVAASLAVVAGRLAQR